MIHLFLLMHLISDFVVQNDSDVEKRKTSIFIGNFRHVFIKSFLAHIVVSILVISLMDISDLIIEDYIFAIVLVVLTHFLIDFFKSLITKYKHGIPMVKDVDSTIYNIWSFIIDQIVHIVFIVIIVTSVLNISIGNLQIIVLINAVLISTFVGHEFIRILLTYMCDDYSNDSKNFVSGKYIGLLERLLYTPAIIYGAYEMFLVIIGLKVFTGFKNTETLIVDRNAFIIGNLLSITLSFVGAIYYFIFR